MVERKDQVHTPDLTKEVGFVFCASRSESSYNAITPKSSYDSGFRRNSGRIRRSSQAGWTEEEDYRLAEVVKKFNGRNWKKIAEYMPGRSDVQCLQRWQKVLNPTPALNLHHSPILASGISNSPQAIRRHHEKTGHIQHSSLLRGGDVGKPNALELEGSLENDADACSTNYSSKSRTCEIWQSSSDTEETFVTKLIKRIFGKCFCW